MEIIYHQLQPRQGFSNCKLCPFIRTTNYIASSQNNLVYPIFAKHWLQDMQLHLRPTLLSPHTHSYSLHWWNQKHIRFPQHKHNILSHGDSVVPNHFNQNGPQKFMLQVSVLQSFSMNPKCLTKSDHTRKKAKQCCIFKLKTYSPIGLNTVTQLNTTDIPLILKLSNSAARLARQVKTICKSASLHSDNLPIITICFSNNKNLKKW